MKIGVFYPSGLPFSACNYIDNVTKELANRGIDCIFLTKSTPLPESVDIYWDPRSMGGTAPYKKLVFSELPLVVTVHGASPFALPAKEHFSTFLSVLRAQAQKLKKLYMWRQRRNYCAAYISVSEYGRLEIVKYLCLNSNLITPIWHGVDHNVFNPSITTNSDQPFLLTISQYQPKKNIDRIIKAYAQLETKMKPVLVAVVPGYPENASTPEKVELIRTKKNHQELAMLYRGAVGFVFPSLHESFGMPIVEAMASGCPVITSNVSACPEVAGDAALLVDPRSVNDISAAMERLVTDKALRDSLRAKGLERAQKFTWKRCAEEHLKVFERVIQEANQ